MKKPVSFLLKGCAFLLVLAALINFIVLPRYTHLYNASILDKYERLRSVQGPKIVLVGGSNLAFSMDSALLEAALGMPVVNFGFHAALGQAFHLEMVLAHIGEGDIVILAPEQYGEATLEVPDHLILMLSMENNWHLWGNLLSPPPGDMRGLFYPNPEAVLRYFKRAASVMVYGFTEYIGQPYFRKEFNAYGDNVFPRPESVITPERLTDVAAGQGMSYALSDVMRDYWNGRAALVREKGATLLMSCPPLLDYDRPEDWETLQQTLEDGLDFPVISDMRDYLFPASLHYDTTFHLTDEGKRLRTERLIADILRWKEEEKVHAGF